ncbi:2-polyprenyl-6-methoxyphenol hydroxylase-like FAD-dependent oxidoreductase [Catenulispora sp. GP43]
MYDVVVIGARCAGSPTAMLFARRGYRVLLLEKARFPQDTLSSHYIHQPGVALLDRWGLLDGLRRAGCRPIDHQSYEAPGVRLDGFSLPVQGHRITYAPRRYVLDPVLAAGAVAAGVDLQESCLVNDLIQEDSQRAPCRRLAARKRQQSCRVVPVIDPAVLLGHSEQGPHSPYGALAGVPSIPTGSAVCGSGDIGLLKNADVEGCDLVQQR